MQEMTIVHRPTAAGRSSSGHHRMQETDSQDQAIYLSVCLVLATVLAVQYGLHVRSSAIQFLDRHMLVEIAAD